MLIERRTHKQEASFIKAIDSRKCNRCLSEKIATDSKNISYCLECFEYGEINSLMYLSRRKRKVSYCDFEIKMDFSLSDFQLKGSQFLQDSYKRKKSVFLQAVCGAGKTEMILETIKTAIDNHSVVCFCIPRVEIIKQIGQRMRKYLPNLKICVLHGENKQIDDSPLIISTPQQLINFYQEFDLMIIDEADAFPYSGNRFLERLVQKAMKPHAPLFMMSATITSDLQKLIKNKEIDFFELFVRYHLRKLPEPKFKKCLNIDDKSVISEIVRLSESNHKLIIYVSSIKKADLLSVKLNGLNLKNQVISSLTKYKFEVIKAFEGQDCPLIISTTILERGVTFTNLNVLVLEADNPIFSTSTLVQIAGRVGRNDLLGEVVFMSRYKSKAMIEALETIKEKNHKYAMQVM